MKLDLIALGSWVGFVGGIFCLIAIVMSVAMESVFNAMLDMDSGFFGRLAWLSVALLVFYALHSACREWYRRIEPEGLRMYGYGWRRSGDVAKPVTLIAVIVSLVVAGISLWVIIKTDSSMYEAQLKARGMSQVAGMTDAVGRINLLWGDGTTHYPDAKAFVSAAVAQRLMSDGEADLILKSGFILKDGKLVSGKKNQTQ